MLKNSQKAEFVSSSPDETFKYAKEIGSGLKGGEVLLLSGSLGAGKTLFTKGLLAGLEFDPDEVTSPSFALVNLYKARVDCYHIDLWRLDAALDPAFAVGLDEILEYTSAVVVIEWSERLPDYEFGRPVTEIEFSRGQRSERTITVRQRERHFEKSETQ